ncbi:methyltransferase domain-containing protein [bacterium]|nr:methyltransferase domain-containing protein [bacterium]
MILGQALSKTLLAALKHMKLGQFTLTLPDGGQHHFQGTLPGPTARVNIHDWNVISRLVTNSDAGFAEDYRDGKWDTDDLPGFLTLVGLNEAKLETFYQSTWWAKLVLGFKKLMHSHMRFDIKNHVKAHTDLGNEFYELWLDPSMSFSGAIFEGKDGDLEAAQQRKHRRILERLKGRGQLLEIGFGWGGFAEEAVKAGHEVTGITRSPEQLSYASARLADAVKRHVARLKLMDFREVKQAFDHIVSIETFEAVGEREWPGFFAHLAQCLKRQGRAVIQTITVNDSIFTEYRKRSEMIQQYSFPGGMLPSPSRFAEEAQKAGLKVMDVYEFSKDYAITLRHWLKCFDEQREQVKKLGFDEGFIRLWRFYLSHCIAGFATERTQVYQYELAHA